MGEKRKREGREGEVPEAAQGSDTEYPPCDLKECPSEIVVKNSGHNKIDGRYQRLDTPSRGRPSYTMVREGKKPVYMFWYKTGKWFVSFELGGSKSFARVEDSAVEGRRQPPCEPHPSVWKVLDQDGKKDAKKDGNDKVNKSYQAVPRMRVIDAKTLDEDAEKELGYEPGATSRHHEKKAKKEKSEKIDKPGDKPAKTVSPAKKVDGNGLPGATKKDFDEEAAAAEAAAGSDSEDDTNSESKSDSDSDSGQSSSSASGSASNQPAAKAPQKAAAAAPAPPGQGPPQDSVQKKQNFELKLRKQLENYKDNEQRQEKLKQVKDMLAKKADHLYRMMGLSATDVKVLMEALDRDFSKPIVQKDAGAQRRAGHRGAAAPSTPPEQVAGAGNCPPHRLPAPNKSAYKKRHQTGRFQIGRTPRITWPEVGSTSFISVESFRSLGEQLWYQQPGAYVTCDGCEKSVPQTMGTLQGEPSRPQFAQCQFLCTECTHHHMTGNTLMGYPQ